MAYPAAAHVTHQYPLQSTPTQHSLGIYENCTVPTQLDWLDHSVHGAQLASAD